MADLKRLDRVFYLVMQHFVATGQAPHYTELAKDLGVSVEEGRKLLHERDLGSDIGSWRVQCE